MDSLTDIGRHLIKNVTVSYGGGLRNWCDECGVQKGNGAICENVIKTLDEERLIKIYNEEYDDQVKDISEINDYDFDYMTKDHDTYNRRKCGSISFTYGDKPGTILASHDMEYLNIWKEFAKPLGKGYNNMIGMREELADL